MPKRTIESNRKYERGALEIFRNSTKTFIESKPSPLVLWTAFHIKLSDVTVIRSSISFLQKWWKLYTEGFFFGELKKCEAKSTAMCNIYLLQQNSYSGMSEIYASFSKVATSYFFISPSSNFYSVVFSVDLKVLRFENC